MKRTLVLTFCLAASAWSKDRIGILVQHGDQWQKKCLSVDGNETITASHATNLAYKAENAPDGAYCKIDGIGCPSKDCFCECNLGGCRYWALFTKRSGDSEWVYAKQGADRIQVGHKDMVAWVWTKGSMRMADDKPKPLSWQEVCGNGK